ncbi:hypothetical protein F4V43_02300 [Paenibacillus spiritus]|uniref:NERD domain-containing protein n=1 Tax=Paenibacillus spiritus TaxID=2496557 RepID=A0A5J5GGX0_9BACL|nr:hypothetical protein [Paenibacillus spiritus]KAA9007337.1 hypothetical protein F4V43_02300 [Paenibacillus spiritus]
MEDSDYRLKHQADIFRERLQAMLKKYDPTSYALFASNIIENVFEDRRRMAHYPMHFILHSIQSNLLYHHEYRHEEITLKDFQKIMKHYKNYYDPIAQRLLVQQPNGVVEFFINMSRQQFYLQQGYGSDYIGRSLKIFIPNFFKKSEKYFIDTYNMSFLEWYTMGFALYAGMLQRNPKILSKQYLYGLDKNIYTEAKIDDFFRLFSITKNQVKEFNTNVVKKIGEIHALFYDTYLQGAFLERPLLKLDDQDNYLAVHKELLMRRVLEGIFDICKKDIPSVFGLEFGASFESYVGEVIRLFNNDSQIITENQLRKLSDKKVCDYVIVYEDYIFLIECKGIEYSAYISSEYAMKGDNSSKKISTGFEQLTSVAKQLNDKVFFDLVGDIQNKKIISAVVTYKQLYQANSDWYYSNVLSEHFEKKDVDLKLFDIKPQIISIMELERILKNMSETNKSIYALFEDKINKGEYLTGDWTSYIQEEGSIPMLETAFNDFVNTQLLALFEINRSKL